MAAEESVAVHAYVLMTNHLHLLMTAASDNGVSAVMKRVGQRYVQKEKGARLNFSGNSPCPASPADASSSRLRGLPRRRSSRHRPVIASISR
ncbi:MAG: hypothetical protein N838_25550 [Thiohalocapsa sp. PB-PSB1]|nr:MAG: hypothetical protein N838_25550 [Thiohalocapsa sp. PB-PSB1]